MSSGACVGGDSRDARVIRLATWNDFHSTLQEYLQLPIAARQQFIFRGHASSAWPLETTLDREWRFKTDVERREFANRLLNRFQREALATTGFDALPRPAALDFVARHHGLPSMLLDWSESPYVAAFFAFAEARGDEREVAIWRLDCNAVDVERVPAIINSTDSLWLNPRAIQQRSVFMRVDSRTETIEHQLFPGLVKFELPASETGLALRALDAMRINAATLFGDLGAAARTAVWRERN